ncbi:type II secretion system F family protein [Desulfotruncus alcoholivorax]|uniref:type II secretion system F family protein n=1 Tax=Desulfotruncus alcoholivorax TaxID=265477 RepID=UPI0004193F16|nr:type II secretion system F family protein [Desulfotruncus alcoholivorax]
MLYILPLVFAAAFWAFLLGYVFIFGERITLARRVDQVVGSPVVNIREKELSIPFAARVIRPLLGKAASSFVKLLPSEKEAILEKKLTRAGLIDRLKPLEFMVIKYPGAVLAGFGALIIAGLLGAGLMQTIFAVTTVTLLGLMVPEFILSARSKKRGNEVEATLPQILDLLTVSVEAGLGFDGAVYKVISKADSGILAAELKRMMQEIKVGKVRKEALKDMAARFDVADLNNFVSAIILGEQLGISIGNVLRRQADQIRLRRRQSAEEKAMKAPIKMLLPLVFLIFPALFIIILGPGAIQISQSLM